MWGAGARWWQQGVWPDVPERGWGGAPLVKTEVNSGQQYAEGVVRLIALTAHQVSQRQGAQKVLTRRGTGAALLGGDG